LHTPKGVRKRKREREIGRGEREREGGRGPDRLLKFARGVGLARTREYRKKGKEIKRKKNLRPAFFALFRYPPASLFLVLVFFSSLSFFSLSYLSLSFSCLCFFLSFFFFFYLSFFFVFVFFSLPSFIYRFFDT
jgi:hypothetical protein